MLAGAGMSASSAVTLVADDEDGGAVCTVELSPAGPGFVTPDARGVLVHTNHFLERARPQRRHDGAARGPTRCCGSTTQRGRWRASRRARSTRTSILDAMRSHRGGSGAICCHPDEGAVFGDRWRTLATVTVEPAERRMTLRRGGPCGRLDLEPLGVWRRPGSGRRQRV